MILGTHTLDVLTPAMVDDHGSQVPDWDDVTEVPVTGCSVQPNSGVENNDDRDAVLSAYKAFLPITTQITSTNRVRYAGRILEVVGEPERWDFPPLSHIAVLLNRWEG